MFSNLDTLHSYDPFAILRVIYDLIFGTKGGTVATTTFAFKAHAFFASFMSAAPYYLINLFARFAVFSFFLSIVLIIIVFIYYRKMDQIRSKLMERVTAADTDDGDPTNNASMENPKWKLVQEHVNSLDANKWKLAILEADIILNELLDTLNLPGQSIGDKLKAVETSDFTSIEEAWEAHKIRNAIAHQGSDFLLNEREVKRVIGLYEKVFKEFEII